MIYRMFGFMMMALLSNPSAGNRVVGIKRECPQDKLSAVRRVLGPEVKGHPGIYPVNENYVARIEVDEAGCIKNIFVFHKLYLNRCAPDWNPPRENPGLTPEKYREILSKISEVQRLGTLAGRVDVGVVTNQKSDVVEEYQHAYVRRRVFSINNSANHGQYSTHSFEVYFIHKVEGLLARKQNANQFGLARLFKLGIDGMWYYTSEQEFNVAIVGAYVSSNSAGPISDGFEDCP